MTQLQKEVEKAQTSLDDVGESLALHMARREEEEGKVDTEDDAERKELLQRKHELEKSVQKVQAEWKATTKDTGNKSVQEKKAELPSLRETAQTWTDNIYVLEEYLGKLAGGEPGNYGGSAAGMLWGGVRGRGGTPRISLIIHPTTIMINRQPI